MAILHLKELFLFNFCLHSPYKVAKIKLAELSASVKGSNVKSKAAEEKNSKMPVNLGPSSTVVDPKGMVSSELL